MDILRTPDHCFESLHEFPYVPSYSHISDDQLGELRLAYVDEGEGPIILCMHGEPSWSYLYRKMIPDFVAAGFRVLAPDLIGFGRSDKPSEREAYSYLKHVEWIKAWIRSLDLQEICLVAQDWGGLIGMRILAEMPERFSRYSLSNTGLPTGDQMLPEAFHEWRTFSQEDTEFDTGQICNDFGSGTLKAAELDSFRAPFPDERYKAGARAFPMLVPASPEDPAAPGNRAAWEVLGSCHKPALMCFSDGDPVTRGFDAVLKERIPGTQGQPHITLSGGHFIQNQDGHRWANAIIHWIRN
jgi:haloalkane dehalogenase